MNNIEVKILMDNNTLNDEFIGEHGLSIHISAGKHNILLDFGQSNDFLLNAKTLGVNIEDVDLAVISHAHYDHTGGLAEFVKKNNTCKVYARTGIDGDYYSKRPAAISDDQSKNSIEYNIVPIGLTKKNREFIKDINIIDSDSEIAEGIHVLCGPTPSVMKNDLLLMETGGKKQPDIFMHESILVFEDNDALHVFTGCCHRGVMSTLDYVSSRFDKPIKSLVGGLHLVSRGENGINEKAAQSAAQAIAKYNIQNIYVGHCTKDAGYEYLQKIYNQTQQFSSGFTFTLS